MDPVGGAASILTLLNAAGGTCKLLHTLVLNIKEASHDIRTQNEKLHCLHQTIIHLAEIYTELPVEHQEGAPWHEWVAKFAIEVASIKAKIERKCLSLDNTKMGNRFQESCRWILFDRQLRRFYDSLEHWNIIFFQAVTVSQLALMVRVDHKTTEIASLSQRIWSTIESQRSSVPCAERFCVDSHVIMASPTKVPTIRPAYDEDVNIVTAAQNVRRSRQHVALAEPVAIKVRHIAWYKTFSLKVGFGPVIGRLCSSNGRERYTTISGGYGILLSFQIPFWTSRRFSFVVFGLLPISPNPALDIRFKLKIPRLFFQKSAWYQAAQKGHTSSLRQWLISGDAGISDATPQGDTLLHVAARSSQVEIISLLIDLGADVNATNDLGLTPLHLCIDQGKSYECARQLLAAGADVFLQCLAGRTPLHTFYNPVTMRLLQSCRDEIDISIQDHKGMTVMHFACWSKLSPVDLLQKPPIGNTTIAPQLNASYGQALTIKDALGRSMLHFAIQRGNIALVEYFLSHPQSQSFTQSDYSGQSLLHYAVTSRRVRVIDLALEHGIDVNARDHLGRTAMHHAAMRGNLAAVKRLLDIRDSGQLQYVDSEGRTPLDLATVFRCTAVIEYLEPFYRKGDFRSSTECFSIGSSEVVTASNRWRLNSLLGAPNCLTLILVFIAVGFLLLAH